MEPVCWRKMTTAVLCFTYRTVPAGRDSSDYNTKKTEAQRGFLVSHEPAE